MQDCVALHIINAPLNVLESLHIACIARGVKINWLPYVAIHFFVEVFQDRLAQLRNSAEVDNLFRNFVVRDLFPTCL